MKNKVVLIFENIVSMLPVSLDTFFDMLAEKLKAGKSMESAMLNLYENTAQKSDRACP